MYVSYFNPYLKPCKEDWFKQQRRPCMGGYPRTLEELTEIHADWDGFPVAVITNIP